MSQPKVFTGARAIIYLNGNIMAFATSVSYSVETDYKPLMEIDNSLPAELTPGRIAVQVVCTGIRVPFGSPSVAGLQPTVKNQMTQPYVVIELRDRGSDATILYVPKAMMVRRTGGVNTRAISSETWTFTGVGFYDEAKPTAVEPS